MKKSIGLKGKFWAAMGVLFICMLAFLSWTKSDRGHDALTIGFVAFLYLIALLTKEIAILFLGMLMVIDWSLSRRFKIWQAKEIIRSLL